MSAKQERRKNRVVWFEIPASDLARATTFYETILSTSLKAETFGTHELRVFAHDDDAASGCLMKGPGFEPSKAGVVAYLTPIPASMPCSRASSAPAAGSPCRAPTCRAIWAASPISSTARATAWACTRWSDRHRCVAPTAFSRSSSICAVGA